jgi:hypothetical protein
MTARRLLRLGLACCLCATVFTPLSIARDEKSEVRTPGRKIVLTEAERLPKIISSGLKVIKFKGEIDERLAAELNRRGIDILDLIEKNTFWARCAGPADLSDLSGIEAVVTPSAEDKITPVLSERLAGIKDRAKAVGVTASFFEGTTEAQARALLRNLGVDASDCEMLFGNRMILEIQADKIEALAASELVMTLEPAPGRKMMHNYNTSVTVGVDEVRREFKVDGTGVNVGIWDGGAVYRHKAFGNRLTIVENVNPIDHATHVAGTIAAAGSNKQARGMAYGARLFSYDYNGDVPSEVASAIRNYGIIFNNNSWGYLTGWEYCYWDQFGDYFWTWFGKTNFGRYTSEAAAYDKLIYNKDVTLVFSAGNDRGDDFIDWVYIDAVAGYIYWGLIMGQDGPYMTIGSNASAKNVVTVGATNGGKAMSSFSSWGPTRDGRVKPEVCAPGVNLYSTLPDNKYGRMSGTSMAAPVVTGSLAVLCELWRNQTGEDPSNALLRNIIAITATDYGSRGPDYKYGFGVINVDKAAQLIAANQNGGVIVEGVVNKSNRTQRYTLQLYGSPASRNVCLAWTDPPARPDAYQTLVNDLDLRVIDPGGKTYYPWKLDGDRPNKGAQTGNNDVDNIELVYLKNAKEGTWTIEVSASYFGKGSRQKFVLSVCLADK